MKLFKLLFSISMGLLFCQVWYDHFSPQHLSKALTYLLIGSQGVLMGVYGLLTIAYAAVSLYLHAHPQLSSASAPEQTAPVPASVSNRSFAKEKKAA